MNNSIRREEILSRTSTSPSPSPPPLPETAVQDGHQRLGELLNLDALLADTNTKTSANNKTNDKSQDTDAKQNSQEGEDEEQEFEFRLFSAPRKPTAVVGERKEGGQSGVDNVKASKEDNATTTQKLRIRLRSPTPGPADISEGRFVNPFRGWSYYFTAPALHSGSSTGNENEDADVALRRKLFEEVAVSGQNVLDWADVPWVSTWVLVIPDRLYMDSS